MITSPALRSATTALAWLSAAVDAGMGTAERLAPVAAALFPEAKGYSLKYSPDQERDDHGRFGSGSIYDGQTPLPGMEPAPQPSLAEEHGFLASGPALEKAAKIAERDDWTSSYDCAVRSTEAQQNPGQYHDLVQAAMDREIADQGLDKDWQDTADSVKSYLDSPDTHVNIRCSAQALDGIIDDGRIKSQFETNESGGLLDHDARAAYELNYMGYKLNTAPAERPIYGYVDDKGEGRDGGESIDYNGPSQYGSIRLVLNDSAKAATTVTVGDSLRGTMLPQPYNSFDKHAVPFTQVGDGGSDLTSRSGIENFQEGSYIEAQVHGGVKLSDVKYVDVPDYLSNQNPGIIEKARNAGLTVRSYRTEDPSYTSDPEPRPMGVQLLP